ncbi:MAG: type II toxin-antitoxin system VapC family toxin [Candidatus Nealsonbacteria bacterium]|nr:type II toxin-antitoxin system VapC family toxin [Candidatus Nealsonbacteria bacterium]
MRPVFADTSYYLALLSPGDVHHTKAVDLSRSLRPPIVVTEFVLIELANALSRADTRHCFVDLLTHVRSDPTVTIVLASAELFERGYQLYAHRPDKDWSLTDCISFVVMQNAGLKEALTADRHFEQAGFQVLLK